MRDLNNGSTKSCGCLRADLLRQTPARTRTDITGMKFNKLTVIEPVKQPSGRFRWRCICDCGNEWVGSYSNLHQGKTKSCGCLKEAQKSLTMEEKIDRRLIPGYHDWRVEVYKRDDYACVRCGSKHQLNAHHMEGYSSNPDLRTDLRNGITLCASCHIEFHQTHGYNHNSTYQMLEFLED